MHFCRTSDLGKRVYRCDPCNHEATVFNSCGDRNCPQCSGAKRGNWLDSTLQLTIPQATYFQVVFTLPESLVPQDSTDEALLGRKHGAGSRVEFVQQWSLHILPKEFTKSRFFGAWSGSKRRMYMEACRALAPVAPSSATADTRKCKEADPTTATPPRVKSCPHCQGSMQCIVKEPRPRWRELFYGPGHPAWYEWTSRGLCSPPDDLAEAGLPGEEVVDLSPDLFDEIIASRLE